MLFNLAGLNQFGGIKFIAKLLILLDSGVLHDSQKWEVLGVLLDTPRLRRKKRAKNHPIFTTFFDPFFTFKIPLFTGEKKVIIPLATQG